ncbi:MAG: hypothetical protein SPL02_03155 [Bacilli bacterium]|nr:hypothetical protein [Bacilli bacterium]MDY6430896.1 hypothetical protein [Bacilli bacterium]
MSTSPVKNGKKQARQRRIKRLAIIGVVITTIGIGVLTFMAFLPRNSEGFVITDDTGGKSASFRMKTATSESAPTVTYLKAKGLSDSVLCEAYLVEDYLASFKDIDSMAGANIYDSPSGKGQFASIYTVYLENASATEDSYFRYRVDYEGNRTTEGANNPYEYVRFLVQTSVVENDGALDHSLANHYYGAKSASVGTVISAEDDRECVSSWQKEPIDEEHLEDLVRRPVFKSSPNEGYCVNFTENKGLIDVKETIPAGKTLRFSFVVYFEGNDPDSGGVKPSSAYLLFSLHFGVDNE